MALDEFLEEAETPDRAVVVVNRTAPDPVRRMLGSLFERQPISIEDASLPDAEEDQVLLVEDDSVLASCPLAELQDAILLVNSDLFVTGARGLDEISVPAVLERLDEVPFLVRGYPEAHSEKLLLILISRYIERKAWDRGTGTLRSSFQNLARIEDERGTRQVYRRIDDSGVDVHVYGAPGWEPPPGSSITAHAGYRRDFLESWFVVYTPPEDAGDVDPVALLAIEEGANEWRGFWTYRESTVDALEEYIAHEL